MQSQAAERHGGMRRLLTRAAPKHAQPKPRDAAAKAHRVRSTGTVEAHVVCPGANGAVPRAHSHAQPVPRAPLQLV